MLMFVKEFKYAYHEEWDKHIISDKLSIYPKFPQVSAFNTGSQMHLIYPNQVHNNTYRRYHTSGQIQKYYINLNSKAKGMISPKWNMILRARGRREAPGLLLLQGDSWDWKWCGHTRRCLDLDQEFESLCSYIHIQMYTYIYIYKLYIYILCIYIYNIYMCIYLNTRTHIAYIYTMHIWLYISTNSWQNPKEHVCWPV